MQKKHKTNGSGLKTRLLAVAIMAAFTLTAQSKIDKEIFAYGQEQIPGNGIVLPNFDIAKDLLIAGYDNRVDLDDIHAHASFASIIRHPDYKGLNYFAVYGAYGIQRYVMKGDPINGCPEFFGDSFGEQYQQWIDADQEWDKAAQILKEKAGETLKAGGRVWVAEGGQSDLAWEWVMGLLDEGEIPPSTIKSNVIIVQHSHWNWRFTEGGHEDDGAWDDTPRGLRYEFKDDPKNRLEDLIEKTTFLGPGQRRVKGEIQYRSDGSYVKNYREFGGGQMMRSIPGEYQLIRNGNPPYLVRDFKREQQLRHQVRTAPNAELREIWARALEISTQRAEERYHEKTGGDLRTDYKAWLDDPNPNKDDFKLWHNDSCGPDYILGAGLDFSDTIEILFILDEDELYDEYYEIVENRNLMQDFLDRFVLYP
jgi:hypothetical protein